VLKITKGTTALLIPNSINIVTSRKEYCFRSFWDRDECYYQMAAAYRAFRRLPPAPRDAIFDSRSIDKGGNMEASSAGGGPTASPSSSFSSVLVPALDAAQGDGAPSPSPSPSPSPPLPSAAAPRSPPRPTTPMLEDDDQAGASTTAGVSRVRPIPSHLAFEVCLFRL
jgi:hypothetical protein